MEAQEYLDILKQHGRRVANRAAYASTPIEERAARGLAGFYADHRAMYSDEAKLPENERCTTGMIDTFHPGGTLYWHYVGVKKALLEISQKEIPSQWVKDFAAMPEQWQNFVHWYLFHAAEEQKRDALLELLERFPEDEPFLTSLYEISKKDKFAIRLFALRSSRWPDPGTPEAESFISIRTERKRESQGQDSGKQG
jgi:hypothetical protein